MEGAEMFHAMAGLRNTLVHVYASVDREETIEYSKNMLRDVMETALRIVY